jgi:hypothetical protein
MITLSYQQQNKNICQKAYFAKSSLLQDNKYVHQKLYINYILSDYVVYNEGDKNAQGRSYLVNKAIVSLSFSAESSSELF